MKKFALTAVAAVAFAAPAFAQDASAPAAEPMAAPAAEPMAAPAAEPAPAAEAAPAPAPMAAAEPATSPDADSQFAGFRIEALVGYDNVGVKGLKNPDGVAYGIGIGYDIQADGWVFGVEGEVADSTAKRGLGDGAKLVAERDLYIGGRLGYVASENILVYLKAGYTNARTELRVPGPNFSAKGDGYRVGVGVEYALGTNLFVKAEYRYSNYEEGVTRNQGIVGVGFRF